MRKPRYLTRTDSEPTAPAKIGDESWSLVRLTTPMWNDGVRLDAFIVFGHDGQLIAEKLFDPKAPGDHATDALRAALTNPRRGKVRKPSEVRVEDAALVELLRPLCANVRHVEHLGEADAFFAALRSQTAARVPGQTFARAGVSERLLREFLDAMAAYERATPSEHANDEQPLSLTIAALGVDHAAVTVVHDGDLGLAIHEGDDFLSLDALATGERGERQPFEHGLISAFFGRLDEQSVEMAVELRKLAVDEAHAPLPYVLGPDSCARPLERRDVVLLIAAARTIVRVLATDADVFADDSEKTLELEETFEIDGEAVRVQVTAPHPHFDWLMPAIDDEDDEEEEHEHRLPEPNELERQIRDAFLASSSARDDAWRMRATRILNELFDYTNASEARLGEWTMGELERFVLTDLPGCIEDSATLAQAPETITEFARFLRAEQVPRIDLDAIEKRMRKIRPRLDELVQARHTKLLA